MTSKEEIFNKVYQTIIDEVMNKDIVTTNSLKAGETGPVIIIKTLKGQKIEIIGETDVKDQRDAHTLRTRIADKDDRAIDLMTKILITHEKFNETVRTIKLYYGDIGAVKDATLYEDIDLTKPVKFYTHKNDLQWYRFKNTMTLDEGDRLIISVIGPNRDIEKVKIALGATIITK